MKLQICFFCESYGDALWVCLHDTLLLCNMIIYFLLFFNWSKCCRWLYRWMHRPHIYSTTTRLSSLQGAAIIRANLLLLCFLEFPAEAGGLPWSERPLIKVGVHQHLKASKMPKCLIVKRLLGRGGGVGVCWEGGVRKLKTDTAVLSFEKVGSCDKNLLHFSFQLSGHSQIWTGRFFFLLKENESVCLCAQLLTKCLMNHWTQFNETRRK